jgi:hypothetical protein
MHYFLLLALGLQLLGYDASFSRMIEGVYREYHVKEGDWCDQVDAKVREVVRKKGREVSFLELKKAGIDEDYLDAMALEYCKVHPDAYIAIIWPTLDDSYEKLVYDTLSEGCIVAYQKRFTLKNYGPMAFLLSIPEKVPFISKEFHGYFDKDKKLYPMRCFVIRARRHAVTLKTKQKLRKLVGIGRYSIHINDTHDQCMDLAFMLLNNNSIHFLNEYDLNGFTPHLDFGLGEGEMPCDPKHFFYYKGVRVASYWKRIASR